MFERFARATREIVRSAVEEAGRRGDRRIGTEHLLIALLEDPALAGLVGADRGAARAVATRLDREAVAAIGLDVGDFGPVARRVGSSRAPFTPGAKAVLKRSLGHTVTDQARRIAPKHLMLALLERRQPDPAAALLAAFAVDPRAIRQRLAEL